jgi:hypothetical protein
MRGLVGLCVGSAIVVVLSGCASDGGATPGFTRRAVDGPPAEVLQAGDALLKREFGRTQLNRGELTVTTEPVESTATSGSGTARDLYGGTTRLRRRATLVVESHGQLSVACLRVEVERQDTQRRSSVSPATGRLGDSPSQTPPPDDVATTEQQNAVWTRVKRDTELEQDLLTELRNKFAPPVTPGSTSQPADGAATSGAPAAAQ